MNQATTSLTRTEALESAAVASLEGRFNLSD